MFTFFKVDESDPETWSLQRLRLVFASYSLSLPSCYCFVLICIHNGAVSSCSALPGTRWPSSNLPRRKGPVCRHRAQIWPSAVILVRQTEPSRGSARLLHQVSMQVCPLHTLRRSGLCGDSPLFILSPQVCHHGVVFWRRWASQS